MFCVTTGAQILQSILDLVHAAGKTKRSELSVYVRVRARCLIRAPNRWYGNISRMRKQSPLLLGGAGLGRETKFLIRRCRHRSILFRKTLNQQHTWRSDKGQRNKRLFQAWFAVKVCAKMQTLSLASVFALVLTVYQAEDGLSLTAPTFDENYLVGMRAYTREDWAVCTGNMQQAVEDFERYRIGSLKCLKQCESQKVSCKKQHVSTSTANYTDRYLLF